MVAIAFVEPESWLEGDARIQRCEEIFDNIVRVQTRYAALTRSIWALSCG